MKKPSEPFTLDQLALGRATDYASQYQPDLLQAVPRSLNRDALGISDQQPFTGVDVWNGYELSWLNNRGKPVIALMRCSIDSTSPNIIESKSFKLYLNSFNQTQFESEQQVQRILIEDLSKVAASPVEVSLFGANDLAAFDATELPGYCLDSLDIAIDQYDLSVDLLQASSNSKLVNETVHSHLLKSNCLITNQPDWASVIIDYSGQQIDHAALLRYLISFRTHNEFHEQCVERIFTDILEHCAPDTLSVQALYTRRGGLDINPYRTNTGRKIPPHLRINRQ